MHLFNQDICTLPHLRPCSELWVTDVSKIPALLGLLFHRRTEDGLCLFTKMLMKLDGNINR